MYSALLERPLRCVAQETNTVCPNPSSNSGGRKQDTATSIKALEEQIKLLAQRLSRAETRLKDLEGERQGGWKKFSDP